MNPSFLPFIIKTYSSICMSEVYNVYFRFYSLLKDFEGGRISGESFRKGTTWMTPRMRKAIIWLKGNV